MATSFFTEEGKFRYSMNYSLTIIKMLQKEVCRYPLMISDVCIYMIKSF